MDFSMSRRPIGETAMTGAERARRLRQKHGTVTKVTKPTDPDTAQLTGQLAQAEARIRDLEAQLARAKAEIAEQKAELARERQRQRRAETEASAAKAPPLPRAEADERTIMVQLRALAGEHDPEMIRAGITAVADMLEDVVGPVPAE